MKSIFLSMLAIAALASCTQENFNVDPPGTQPQEGEKMFVDITLTAGEITKAASVPNATEEKTISDVTVFFLNPTNQIVSRTYVSGASLTDDPENAAIKKATVETRTTATQMMVIANIGEDRTGTAKPLNLSTRAQLEAAEQDLATEQGSVLKPFQEKSNVLMSGDGIVTTMTPDPDGGPSTATATVTLNYIGAKISLKKIAISEKTLGTYGSDYKFTRAFLLNVQTKSRYFPTTGAYLPATKVYANGVEWDTAWGDDPGYPVVADFNQPLDITSITTSTPATDIAHWYVFENNPASVAKDANATILAVEVEWTKVKGDGGSTPTVIVKKMFNVIFAPGDKGVIEAGKAYDVELTFTGDFRPENDGGNGGGGDDNPDQPNISANVDITVTPADWTGETVQKPF